MVKGRIHDQLEASLEVVLLSVEVQLVYSAGLVNRVKIDNDISRFRGTSREI